MSIAQSERQRMAALDYQTVARIHADSPSEAFAEELARRDDGFEGAAREGLRELDDAELFRARQYPRIREMVEEEIAHRKAYERRWTAPPWRSGPDSPVPPPPPEYQHIVDGVRRGSFRSHKQARSREEVRRSEYQKLRIQAHSQNKLEREAARYILSTCYHKSRS